MTALGDFWKTIAPRLGIDVVAPFHLHLADGKDLVIDALVKNYGYENGMLLVDDYSKIESVRHAVVKMGYGYSTLSGPHDPDNFSVEDYREILSDWTWSGPPAEKPEWLADMPREASD